MRDEMVDEMINLLSHQPSYHHNLPSHHLMIGGTGAIVEFGGEGVGTLSCTG